MKKKPEYRHFLLDIEGSTAILTVNRPEVRNALGPESWEELYRFSLYLQEEEELRAAIITGGAGRAFVSGADVGALKKRGALDEVFDRGLLRAVNSLESGRKTVIAAINGYALGGGLELALGCDIRILSERAVLGFPETGLGIIPGAGGIQRLVRIAGTGIAREMVLTGRRLNAEEAVRCGLAMEVVPGEQLLDRARQVAALMAEKGPVAVAFAKRAVMMAADVNVGDALYMEGLMAGVTFSTEDCREGMQAFHEKRKPVFQGR